jgi:hypothetical protein
MAMKSQVARDRVGSGKTPAAAVAKETATGEIVIGNDEPEADEDEDVFKEIPTVSNRANPTFADSAHHESASLPTDAHDGAGTYRIVHPTTSDFIAPPAAIKIDADAARRAIIGVARKPK